MVKLDEGGGRARARHPGFRRDLLLASSPTITLRDATPAACRMRPRRALATASAETVWDAAYATSCVTSATEPAWRSPVRAGCEVATSERSTRKSSAAGNCMRRSRARRRGPWTTSSVASRTLRRFLFLPALEPTSCCRRARRAIPEAAARQDKLEQIVPAEPRRAIRMHKVLEVLFDRRLAVDAQTGCSDHRDHGSWRGWTPAGGVLASNRLHYGGALARSRRQLTASVAPCDSFTCR